MKKSFICYFKIIYSVIVNVVWFVIFFLGSKPRTKPKRQPPTKEEKTFKRRAKYFVIAQLVAVVLFVSVISGYRNNADVELDDDDLGHEWKWIHLFIFFSMTNLDWPHVEDEPPFLVYDPNLEVRKITIHIKFSYHRIHFEIFLRVVAIYFHWNMVQVSELW